MSTSAEDARTRTICPYCGVGCGLRVRTEGGRLLEVEDGRAHDAPAVVEGR